MKEMVIPSENQLIIVDRIFGKGEVDSSILSGSTSKISNKQTI